MVIFVLFVAQLFSLKIGKAWQMKNSGVQIMTTCSAKISIQFTVSIQAILFLPATSVIARQKGQKMY
ncbi:hypothetical protein UO88_07995 [Enterobacter hormaechei]|nr:hypothetical protein UO88_07995 [Enterobacter hormaechei]